MIHMYVFSLIGFLACGGTEKEEEYEGDAAGECSDAADNDRDGLFDCEDDGCAGSPDCDGQDTGSSDTGSEDTGISDTGEDTGTEETCVAPTEVSATEMSVRITGATADTSGWDIAVCDLNGDDIDDLIVSGLIAGGFSGEIGVFLGGAGRFTSDLNFADADVLISGASAANPTSWMGAQVRCGDVDGDQDLDLVVSRGGYAATTSQFSFLYHSIVGLFVFENTGSAWPAIMTHDDARLGLVFDSEPAEDYGHIHIPPFWIDDYNGDGIDEVLLYMSNDVYSTPAGQVAANADNKIWSLDVSGEGVDVDMESVVSWKLTPNGSDSVRDIQLLDDVSGDGTSDLFIGHGNLVVNNGTPGEFNLLSEVPSEDDVLSSFEYFAGGGSSDAYLGWRGRFLDLDGDGSLEALVTAPGEGNSRGALRIYSSLENPTEVSSFSGNGVASYLGWALESTGDVDGDGIEDILLAEAAVTTDTFGKVYLLSGACLGTEESLSAASIGIWNGELEGAYFGNKLASGDLNGDGVTDVVISAHAYDPNGVNPQNPPPGRIYIQIR
jgi:hypothetical protein